jgi:transcriptional regulator NrdR family protein|tara:strand:+ start:133 stop:417 length:285 start_codon:yes stop_codon:yes gene_type:complete
MICPKCGGRSKVYNSRPKDDTIRRHRQCLKCNHRYTTVEVLEQKDKAIDKPKEKPVKLSIVRKPVKKKKRFEDLDFDNMTDEEIEKAMFEEDLS